MKERSSSRRGTTPSVPKSRRKVDPSRRAGATRKARVTDAVTTRSTSSSPRRSTSASPRRTATKKATGPQRLGLFFGSHRDREAAPVRTPSTAGMRRTRFHVMVAIGLVCMVGLVGRSFWVQVAHGAGYRAEGVQQRQRFTAITASRGTIFDRDGNEMAITVQIGRAHV